MMEKPDKFRAALVAAIPGLADHPENLLVFADKGQIVSRMNNAGSLGYEWRYTLTAVLIDFTHSPDAVAIQTLLWIQSNQPDLLLNHERADQAINFKAEIIDTNTVDLEISFDITEAVDVKPRDAGGHEARHRGEPKLADGTGIDLAEFLGQVPDGTKISEIWLGDDLIVKASP